MWAQIGATASGAREGLWYEKVHIYPIWADPASRLVAGQEVSLVERFFEKGSVAKVVRPNREVTICRVLDNREVSVTGVEVDRLGTHENKCVAIRLQGRERVEEDLRART